MLTVVIDPGHGGIERIGGSSPNNATGDNLTEISGIGTIRHKKLASIDIQSFKNLAELDGEYLRICAQKLNVNIKTIKTWKREAQSRI